MTTSPIPPRAIARLAVTVVAALFSSACTGAGSAQDDDSTVRVGFLQDLTVPSHVDLVSPSFLAFEQALREGTEGSGAEVEVVQMDTEGDPVKAAEFAREIAADPSYVAAIVAPFWSEPADVATTLAEAGVPTVSLSPQSPSPWSAGEFGAPVPSDVALGGLWRRLVPDRSVQAAELADLIGHERERTGVPPPDPVCRVVERSSYAEDLDDAIASALPPEVATTSVSEGDMPAAIDLIRDGCSRLVWIGSTEGVSALAAAMADANLGAPAAIDLAPDAVKTVGPSSDRSLDDVAFGSVTCPCVDVTTSLDPAAHRFINAYQAANGLPPGVYAAEGWDAGQMLARSIRDGAHDRSAVSDWLAPTTSWDGVSGSLTFDEAGELRQPRAHVFDAAGTRWLPAD
jgi:branched-chain amino acid transport system substrate-binding protein